MKKQIFIIANSITNSMNISGGDKNFIELAKVWIKKDCHITVITVPEGQKLCLRAGLDVNFLLLPDININKYGLLATCLYRCLASIAIFKSPYSIPSQTYVLSSSHYLTDLLPAFWLKLRNKKIKTGVFWHLIFPFPLKGYTYAYKSGFQFPRLNDTLNWVSQFFSLFLTKYFCDQNFCINEEITQKLLRMGFQKKKVLFFHGGAIEYQSIKQIPQPSRQTYDCLFIGRFHPQKGLDDLPAIWQGIIRHLPQAKLGVIGAGPCEITQKLKDNIARKGLNNSVTLLGFIDDEEKFKILKASAVYLFPSHYESFGATLVEAQSCGKPSVAYDLPPVVSIFKKGVLFAPLGNTYKFSQLVIQLLTDQSFYQRISLESDEHARNFSWTKSAQWLLTNFFPVKVSPS